MGQASPASAPKPAALTATAAPAKTTTTGANGQKMNHYTFNVADGSLVKAQTGPATPSPAVTATVRPSISAETEASSSQ